REDAPELFTILDRLIPAFGIALPRLILTDELAISPCTVGGNPPTIILPLKLVRELGEHQLEAILAHELAHVSRKDGLLRWPSLMLRDLQAYNPLAHWLFNQIVLERESWMRTFEHQW
ncbi:MAG: M56 family metallopeptidase, partial [Chloroflexota bacterium]